MVQVQVHPNFEGLWKLHSHRFTRPGLLEPWSPQNNLCFGACCAVHARALGRRASGSLPQITPALHERSRVVQDLTVV